MPDAVISFSPVIRSLLNASTSNTVLDPVLPTGVGRPTDLSVSADIAPDGSSRLTSDLLKGFNGRLESDGEYGAKTEELFRVFLSSSLSSGSSSSS